MKKPWSITTTIRNPERILDILRTSKELEGQDWNYDTQVLFQILLIRDRLYGFGSTQFYNGLSPEIVAEYDNLENSISTDFARRIFEAKNYVGPDMRGRQSMSVLKKFCLVETSSGKVRLTALGEKALTDEFDLGQLFLRIFLRWQLPNPLADDFSAEYFDTVPFISTLQLINKVNSLSRENNLNERGISRRDFQYFVMCLAKNQDVDMYANKIVELRKLCIGKNRVEIKEITNRYYENFLKEFLETNDIERINNNLKDYSDNAIRYFRLTKLINLRGKGYYIDLEPRRSVEIEAILANNNGKAREFENEIDYISYISNSLTDPLPWATMDKLHQIYESVVAEILQLNDSLGIGSENYSFDNSWTLRELEQKIAQLREIRSAKQSSLDHVNSQREENVEEYKDVLSNIFTHEDKPITLEKYATLSLHALNDSIKILPNYPIGDDNEPTFTAPAGVPDIECYYNSFNAICEVTMLTSRDQWYNEGQPVMRHLRDFEEKTPNKKSYCLFIAPELHRDTLNTFWNSVKYEYEGEKQRIVPMSINSFVKVLNVLLDFRNSRKPFAHTMLQNLYDRVVDTVNTSINSEQWYSLVPTIIDQWKQEILNEN